MMGNPFSPDYAAARQRGNAPALSYCSMNVAVYGRHASAWCLEERRVSELHRSGSGVAMGSSAMRWTGDSLVVEIDERSTPVLWPFRSPIRGRVTLRPEICSGLALKIDSAGEHHWWPVAPLANIEVEMSEPNIRFSGHGYHDANAGDISLESTFDSWSWSRARTHAGAVLAYDVDELSGGQRSLSFRVTHSGRREDLVETAKTTLSTSHCGLTRFARTDKGTEASVVRSLEDGPFYSRALVRGTLGGENTIGMHETLSLQRFRQRWVREAIAYRMRVATR